MKINIYYGGRGLLDDPTLYVVNKMEDVLKELRVNVERYNIYEHKNEISTLPHTFKEADGIILATTVEWLGIGGYMQQFLDSCWLYGDKELMSELYMQPIVMSTTYGEREGVLTLENAWEMLGGQPCSGLCGYVEDLVTFELNEEYTVIIEKKAETLYRTISQKIKALPSSNQAVKQTVLRTQSMDLTPQESEQLSKYVSDDSYVKKQKEDIEELANLFKEMLDGDENPDRYISELKSHFVPPDDMQAVFQIDLTDENRSLVIEVDNDKLKCYFGSVQNPDVTARTKSAVFNDILSGKKPFQNAFMSGELSAQGNFKVLRNFDTVFRFV